MFKCGFSSLACPDYTLDQIIDLTLRSGLTGVELRFVAGKVDLTEIPELGPERIAETRRRFEDAGLSVVSIDTSVRLWSLDRAERERQRVNARANIEIARGLGAPYIRVFGGPLPPDQDRERTLDAIATGLGGVADEAAERGVTALLETHDDFSTSASVLDLYRRGASENLLVLWDTLHTYRHGETPEYTWSQLGHLIRHVHVKDSHVANEEGFDFALTGEGNIPLGDIVEVLRRRGYDGYVHFEWEKAWHPEIADAEIAVPHFGRYMAEVL